MSSSSSSSDNEASYHYRSGKSEKSSQDRHRGQRRGSHDDCKMSDHHKSRASTSTGKSSDRHHHHSDSEDKRPSRRSDFENKLRFHHRDTQDERHRHHGKDKGDRHRRHGQEEYDRHHHDDRRREDTSPRAASPPWSLSSMMYLEHNIVSMPKKEVDVIRCMENAFTDGPLEVLKRCMHDGQKVMVWVRGNMGIRGICTGFVLAFDKFWNMVMQDVDEFYHANINPKTPSFLPEREACNLPEYSKYAKNPKKPTRESLPEEVILGIRAMLKKRDEERRREKKEKEQSAMRKRNIAKMFLRGDNVIFVKICE